MRLIFALLAAASLGGCVAYGGGVYGDSTAYYGQTYGTYGYYDSPRHYGYRDRDADGVPNRYDRYPDNPYRR